MDGLAAAAAVLSIPTDNNAEKEMGQGSTPGTLGDNDPQASSIEAMDIDTQIDFEMAQYFHGRRKAGLI